VIFSFTLTKFRPPTASPARMATIKLMRINMTLYSV
jgi:hypothetical protein